MFQESVGIFPEESPKNWVVKRIGNVKLTFSHLEIDGWKMIISFWGNRPIFRGELLVFGRVIYLDSKKPIIFQVVAKMFFNILHMFTPT